MNLVSAPVPLGLILILGWTELGLGLEKISDRICDWIQKGLVTGFIKGFMTDFVTEFMTGFGAGFMTEGT